MVTRLFVRLGPQHQQFLYRQHCSYPVVFEPPRPGRLVGLTWTGLSCVVAALYRNRQTSYPRWNLASLSHRLSKVLLASLDSQHRTLRGTHHSFGGIVRTNRFRIVCFVSVKNDQVCPSLLGGQNNLLRCIAAADANVLNRSEGEIVGRGPPQTRAIFPHLRSVCDLTVNWAVAEIGGKRYGFRDVKENDLRAMHLGNGGGVAQ